MRRESILRKNSRGRRQAFRTVASACSFDMVEGETLLWQIDPSGPTRVTTQSSCEGATIAAALL